MNKKRPSLADVHQNFSLDLDVPEEKNEKTVESSKKTKAAKKKTGLVDIPIEQIVLDKNIRDTYSDDSLEELGDSIIENGQIQPIIVAPKGDKYVVKIGHRRYKACLLRDVSSVKCIVEDDFESEKDRIITQAIENEQRLNLSSREREAYIAQLIDLGMSQTEIARALHKTKGWVSEALTAYNFASENQDLLSGLSEEPSTRDTWKASQLSRQQFESAIEKAKQNGGTKEAFKTEVSRLYSARPVTKKTSINGGFQKLSLTNTVRINFEESKVFIDYGRYYDEELASILIEDIKKYYIERGYTILQ